MSRYALILGCDDYREFDNIAFCNCDAFTMNETLTEYCDYQKKDVIFEMLYEGGDLSTPDEIYDHLSEKIGTLTGNDTFLFYFAGHGMLEQGKGYLILPGTSRTNISKTSLDLFRIKEIMSSGNCASFLILDACHSGTGLAGETLGLTSGKMQENSCVTLASCSENEQSYPYEEMEQGVFTYYLTEAIKRYPVREKIYIEQIKIWVCDVIKEWCQNRLETQTPTLYGKVIGNIPLAMRNDEVYLGDLCDIKDTLIIEPSRKKYISVVKDRYFVQRKSEMDFIKNNLREQGCVVLYGMRGIGKTSIAVQYAVKEKSDYNRVIVIPCEAGAARGISEYLTIAGIKRKKQDDIWEADEDYSRRMLSELIKYPGEKLLFVFDDLQALDPLIGDICEIPQDVVITTRWDKEKWQLPVLQINAMEIMEHRKELFEKYLGRSLVEAEEKEFVFIDKLVCGHTLTLQLIARQCVESDLRLDEIRRMLEEGGVYSEDANIFSYTNSLEERNMYGHIRALWNIASLDDEEKYILKGLALLPVTGISKREFKEWMGLENLNKLNHLVKKSWIQQHHQGVQNKIYLHSVIAEVIYREVYLKEEDDLQRFILAVTYAFQNRNQEYAERMRYLSYGEHMIRLLTPSFEGVNLLLALSMEEEYEHKLDVAEGILNKVKEHLEQLNQTNSIQAGHLYNNYGVVYQTGRQTKKSIEAYDKAKRIYKSRGEEGIKHYGYTLHNLARIYQDVGEHKKAIQLEEEAEPILSKYWKMHWGEVYDVRANYYASLAEKSYIRFEQKQTVKKMGEAKRIWIQVTEYWKKELQCWQKAISLKKAFEPDNKAKIVVSISPCACVKAQLGDKTAIQDIHEVLQFYIETTGENSKFVGEVYSKMCMIYDNLGNKEMAIKYGKKATEILEACLGKII